MCLSSLMPQLINTASPRSPCKAAWLAAGGRWAVPQGLAMGSRGSGKHACVTGRLVGMGQGLAEIHPLFQPCFPL